MAKCVTSSQNGSGSVWGSYASSGEPAVMATGLPVVVTFQADPANHKADQNK